MSLNDDSLLHVMFFASVLIGYKGGGLFVVIITSLLHELQVCCMPSQLHAKLPGAAASLRVNFTRGYELELVID